MKFSLAQALVGLAGATTVAATTPSHIEARAAAPKATPDPLSLARRSTTHPDSYEISSHELVRRADPVTSFCARFQKSCINVCMANAKVGSSQKVTYSCKTASDVFTFGCKCGTSDRTQNVLTLLGGLTTLTRYTSTKTSTKKTTKRPTVTTSLSSTTTSSETYTLHTSTTETQSTTKTESYSTTTTSLVLIPTTYTSTSVSTVPTTVRTTATATSVSIADLPITSTLPYTVLEIAFNGDPSAKFAQNNSTLQRQNSKKRATDVFCTNYFDACSRQCTRVKSKPSKQKCTRTSKTLFSYRLACLCRNGKTETKHSLDDLEQSLVVKSTLRYATRTQTVTQNQTTTSTIMNTATLTFITESTHLFTVTDISTSRTTSTSVSLTTYSPGRTITTTTTSPVATQTATSTILNIIAPTGALRARHAINDSSVGYINLASSFNRMQIGTQDKASAQQFMLVSDGTNSLYTLMRAGTGDQTSIVCEYDDPNASVPNFGPPIDAMCLPQVLTSDKPYGPASTRPAGNFYGGAIERFIWSPLIAKVESSNTLKLFPQWINNDSSKPNTYLLRKDADIFMTGNKGYVSNRLGGGVDPDQLYLAIEP